MGAVAEAVRQRRQDQVALDLGQRSRPTGAALAGAAAGRHAGAGGAGEVDGVRADLAAAGEQHRAVDDVLELADIAGPGVGEQQPAGLGRERPRRQPVLLGEAGGEVVGEQADVGGALAQRRDPQGDDVEAEVEVLAKAAGGNGLAQVAVGGGDQPDVDLHRPGPADPVDLPLLDGAKQLRLQAHVHLADLVEQQRAAVGLLEPADPAGHGAGKGALLVAEQLGLQQRFRDRRAVDRDEAAARPAARRMQVAGEDLLAGSGLAGDQHAGVAGRDLVGQRHHLGHGRVGVQHRASVNGDGGEHRGDQLGVGRQRDVLLRTRLDCGNRRRGIGVDAAGDHRHGDALGGEAREQRRHVADDVDHHQVDALAGADDPEPDLDVVGMQDLGAEADGDPAGGAELAGERSDDQETHSLCLPCPRDAVALAQPKKRIRSAGGSTLFSIASRWRGFSCRLTETAPSR